MPQDSIPLKDFLYIYAGIDKQRVDLALKVIDEQVLDLQTNLLSEDELSLSKDAIINQLKESQDSQGASLSRLYLQVLLDNKLTLDEQIERVSKVTP